MDPSSVAEDTDNKQIVVFLMDVLLADDPLRQWSRPCLQLRDSNKTMTVAEPWAAAAKALSGFYLLQEWEWISQLNKRESEREWGRKLLASEWEFAWIAD